MAHQLNHYRLLGRSGLRVSPMCLGTMTFGMDAGWCTPDAEAEQMVNTFMEAGGNFIDTANFYGTAGGSEKVLGKVLKGRRSQAVIATKYSLTMRAGDPNASGNHRKNMVQSVEDSLKRLQTDYIDLLYLHIWDDRTPVEEIMRAFDDLVRAGKILYIGMSDLPAWQASRMQAIADLRGWAPIAALQIPYNLTERTVERDLLPMALEMGMGVMPWGPLAGGVLSGKYTRKDLQIAPPTSIEEMNKSRHRINIATGRLNERSLDIAEVVKTVAQEVGKTPSQVALAWTMVHPAITAPILGVRTMDQLKDNLGALGITFSADQIARLEKVSAFDLGFPHSMLREATTMNFMFGGVKVDMPRAR